MTASSEKYPTVHSAFIRLRNAARHLWVEILRALCPVGYRVIRARCKRKPPRMFVHYADAPAGAVHGDAWLGPHGLLMLHRDHGWIDPIDNLSIKW